ncbi:hypothetical protein BDD12DRAFT_829324 [Trichophaea hybrida]|nr:hypothetical protein BDD12DRAFT_829324 [Trichophaea hybrida]
MAYRSPYGDSIIHNHNPGHGHLPLFLNDDYAFVGSLEDDPETPSSFPSESDPTTSNSPSPSTTASTSTVSSSPSDSSPESSEQASPHQPSSPPDHFRNFYAANLPPSPLHHYYTAVYPPPPQPPLLPPPQLFSRPMVETRASSRPPAASSSRNSNGSTRIARAYPPPRNDSSSTSAAPTRRNPLPARQHKLTPIVQMEEKPKKLAGMACIICMEDEPVDLSVTPCGHMFCNKCLYGAIKATLSAPHKVHGKCPVCRGKVAIKDIIVLEIRQRSKGKERAH